MTAVLRRQAAERFGRHAETLCVWRLRLWGYRVLPRRFSAGVGEIDIIAVRQRRHICQATEMFLARFRKYAGYDVRFDVMLVRPWRLPQHVVDAWRLESAMGSP